MSRRVPIQSIEQFIERMPPPPREPGEAVMRIELRDGNITVWHGEDNVVLAQRRNVPKGTWDRLWDGLEKLGLHRLYGTNNKPTKE